MQRNQNKFTKLNALRRKKKLRARIVALSSTRIKNFVKFSNKGSQEIELKLEMKEESRRIIVVNRLKSKNRKKR